MPLHDILIASFEHWRPLAVINALDGTVTALLHGCARSEARLALVPDLGHLVAGCEGTHATLRVWDVRGAVHYTRQVALQTSPPFSADVQRVATGLGADTQIDNGTDHSVRARCVVVW